MLQLFNIEVPHGFGVVPQFKLKNDTGLEGKLTSLLCG